MYVPIIHSEDENTMVLLKTWDGFEVTDTELPQICIGGIDSN